MRGEANEVALASYRNLQGLANPPGCIRRQACAVTDIEAVDGLHQPADGFLEEIRITQRMMAKAFGDVCCQADIGGGEAMFIMDVPIMQATNSWLRACL